MPQNTSKLVARTQMNKNVMFTSTIQNQNYNSGKFLKYCGHFNCKKFKPNVLGLIKITKNLIYQLAT